MNQFLLSGPQPGKGYVSPLAPDLQSQERFLRAGIGSAVIFSGFAVLGAAGHDQLHPAPLEGALFWAGEGMLCLGWVTLTLPGQNLHSAASLICCQTAQLGDAEAGCFAG